MISAIFLLVWVYVIRMVLLCIHLKKYNLDGHVLRSLMRKITVAIAIASMQKMQLRLEPQSSANRSTGAVDHSPLLLFELRIR